MSSDKNDKGEKGEKKQVVLEVSDAVAEKILAMLSGDRPKELTSEEAWRQELIKIGRAPLPSFMPEAPRRYACRSLETGASFVADVQQRRIGDGDITTHRVTERGPNGERIDRSELRDANGNPPTLVWRIMSLIDYTVPADENWPRSIKGRMLGEGRFPNPVVPGRNDQFEDDVRRGHFIWLNFTQADQLRYQGADWDECFTIEYQLAHADELAAAKARIAELEMQAQMSAPIPGPPPAVIVPSRSERNGL